MKAKDFVVVNRPALVKTAKHPTVRFADYERRLQSMQSVVQSIQQAYLGTRERAVIVLEGWDTAGKGGIVRRLGWALDPRSFKVYPIAAPLSHERGRHYLQRFWEKLPDPGQRAHSQCGAVSPTGRSGLSDTALVVDYARKMPHLPRRVLAHLLYAMI
jgi:AMP-polyphosphate phosphotransferase